MDTVLRIPSLSIFTFVGVTSITRNSLVLGDRILLYNSGAGLSAEYVFIGFVRDTLTVQPQPFLRRGVFVYLSHISRGAVLFSFLCLRSATLSITDAAAVLTEHGEM